MACQPGAGAFVQCQGATRARANLDPAPETLMIALGVTSGEYQVNYVALEHIADGDLCDFGASIEEGLLQSPDRLIFIGIQGYGTLNELTKRGSV